MKRTERIFLLTLLILIAVLPTKVLRFQNPRTLDEPTTHEVRTPFPNPKLLSALRAIESSERADAISERGARGLYQIMPLTWRDHCSEPFSRAFDPSLNETVAIAYLIWIRETLSSWEQEEEDSIPLSHILSCWHGGIGRFRSREYNPGRMPGSTQEFVDRMMRRMR